MSFLYPLLSLDLASRKFRSRKPDSDGCSSQSTSSGRASSCRAVGQKMLTITWFGRVCCTNRVCCRGIHLFDHARLRETQIPCRCSNNGLRCHCWMNSTWTPFARKMPAIFDFRVSLTPFWLIQRSQQSQQTSHTSIQSLTNIPCVQGKYWSSNWSTVGRARHRPLSWQGVCFRGIFAWQQTTQEHQCYVTTIRDFVPLH